MIERLRRLIRTSSPSGAEGGIADALSVELTALGFDVRRSGHNLYFPVTDGEGPTLLFNSHLDTVPVCDGWTRPPLGAELEGDCIYGLGANDAKGSVAAMLEAAIQVRSAARGGARVGRLWAAFTAAEETGGEGLATILSMLPRLHAAVVGEPTGCRAVLAQKGLLILCGVANGVAGHAAHGERSGAKNAIHMAVRDITVLTSADLGPAHPLLGPPTLQVTQIQAGVARNTVPDRCEFWVDIRTNPGADPETLAAGLSRQVESELRIHSSRLVAVDTSPSEVIAQAAVAASGAPPEGSRTTSDWVHLRGVPTVKLGPGDTARSHRANEYITVPELETGARVYADLAMRYFALSLEGSLAWQ